MLLKPIRLFALAVALLLAACNSKEKAGNAASGTVNEIIAKEQENLKTLEKAVKNASSDDDKKEQALQLEKELVKLSVAHKNDTASARWLYKAALLNEGILQNYPEAYGHYTALYKDYPNTKYAPVALFKQGLIMETYFQKNDKAIYLLDEFIKKYPEHKLVDMAKQVIATSGVDADAIYRRFNQKNSKNQ